jgi:hypothetical protein
MLFTAVKALQLPIYEKIFLAELLRTNRTLPFLFKFKIRLRRGSPSV